MLVSPRGAFPEKGWVVSQLRDLESNGDPALPSWGTASPPGWVHATQVFPALLGAAGAGVAGYWSWQHVSLSVLVSAAPFIFSHRSTDRRGTT